jgi:hypothetical protein
MNVDPLLVLLGGLIVGCSVVLLSTYDKAYSDAIIVKSIHELSLRRHVAISLRFLLNPKHNQVSFFFFQLKCVVHLETSFGNTFYEFKSSAVAFDFNGR